MHPESTTPCYEAMREVCTACGAGRYAPGLGRCAVCWGAGYVYVARFPAWTPDAAARAGVQAIQTAHRDHPRSLLQALRYLHKVLATLQTQQRSLSQQEVASLLAYAQACVALGLEVLTPKEHESSEQAAHAARATDARYYVYRVLVDGKPVYVGQTANVPERVKTHLSRASRAAGGVEPQLRALRAALQSGQAITYEVVAQAATRREVAKLERAWMLRTITEGHDISNGFHM